MFQENGKVLNFSGPKGQLPTIPSVYSLYKADAPAPARTQSTLLSTATHTLYTDMDKRRT